MRFDCDLSLDLHDPEMEKHRVNHRPDVYYRQGLTKAQRERFMKDNAKVLKGLIPAARKVYSLVAFWSFSSWFEEHGLLDSDATYDADPDEDSLTNLLEYALGTNTEKVDG